MYIMYYNLFLFKYSFKNLIIKLKLLVREILIIKYFLGIDFIWYIYIYIYMELKKLKKLILCKLIFCDRTLILK